MLHILKTDLLKEKDTDTSLTKDIKKCSVEDIAKRYTESKLGVGVSNCEHFSLSRFSNNTYHDCDNHHDY